MLYFALYNVTLPDIMMYIYLFIVTSLAYRAYQLDMYQLFKKNIYEMNGWSIQPNKLQGPEGRAADDQHQDRFLLIMIFPKFYPLRADWKKTIRKMLL